MGRYAFFSTGLEYKFVFGYQSSRDILLFGGEYMLLENGEHLITWDATFDLAICEQVLQNLEIEHGCVRPNLDSFSKDIEGTSSIKLRYLDTELHPTYLLGLLIYHQLLYEPDLSVEFESYTLHIS